MSCRNEQEREGRGSDMNRKISMLGVPMDLGQGRRGVDMGASALRYADAIGRLQNIGYDVTDLGNVWVPERTDRSIADEKLKYLSEVTSVSLDLAERVSNIIQKGCFPLIFGGDHSISIGTIAGISQHYKQLGVIWYDAHGDLNTEQTSPSGNIHGMPLAVGLGVGHPDLTRIGGFAPKIKPENVVIVGARELDDGEKEYIREAGLKVFTMHEIDRLGMTRVMEEAIAHVRKNTDGVHLSLDVDGMDPYEAPGVGTPG
jgi:arginase